MLLIIMNISDNEDRMFVESLYSKYSKRLYQYALDIIKDSFDAEECVNDVIIRVIEHLDQFKNTDEVSRIKLLTVYVRNLARTKYVDKKQDLHNTIPLYADEEDDMQTLDLCDDRYDPEKIVMSDANCDLLTEIVNNLDGKYYEVIMLKYCYNFDNDVIAKKLNISESTVRTRLQRAREMILASGKEDLYE